MSNIELTPSIDPSRLQVYLNDELQGALIEAEITGADGEGYVIRRLSDGTEVKFVGKVKILMNNVPAVRVRIFDRAQKKNFHGEF